MANYNVSPGYIQRSEFFRQIGEEYCFANLVLNGNLELKDAVENKTREVSEEEIKAFCDECEKRKREFTDKVYILADWMELPGFWLAIKWKMYRFFEINAVDLKWLKEADKTMTKPQKDEALIEIFGFKDTKELEEYRFDSEMDFKR